MKNSRIYFGLLVASVVLVANTVLATGPTYNAPDAGSTALLLAIAGFGFKLSRKLFR